MRVIDDNNITPAEAIAKNKQAANANNSNVGTIVDKKLMPSNGAFYPNDIYATPFTGLDLKDITNVEENNANQVIYKILNRRLTGININDILINDKLWFIYFIRELTYKKNPVQIKCTCPHCGAQSIQQYTLDKLNIQHYNKKLPDTQTKLPNEDLIEFTFPTIGTESQINRLKHDPSLLEPIDDQFMLLASYIKTINGKKVNLWQAYEYIRNVDAPTFCFVIHKLDEYSFVCDRTATFKCACGEDITETIQLTQDFFIPKLF